MYRLTISNALVRILDGANIPRDPGNRDYAEFLAWVEAGNKPEAPPVPDTRPAVLADFKTRREVYLNRLTGIAGRMTRAGLDEVATAADTFAQGLLDLPDQLAVLEAADGNAMKRAIMLQYRILAANAAATPGAEDAFDKVSV